jgi:hypothetical protein
MSSANSVIYEDCDDSAYLNIFNHLSIMAPPPDQFKQENIMLTQDEMLKNCHGARAGHHGSRRTWKLLNDSYPGHGISADYVREFIASCPVCQKVRLGMQDALIPIIRHLKTEAPRKVVGVDYLSLEQDKFGNNGLYVVRDHFTKYVALYPVSGPTSLNLAHSLFRYATTFGVFDVLISDPGSDLTSGAISQLNNWFGIHHRISIVNRHESNGVEGANKQVLRHLRALICDERVKDRWSDASVLCWVQFLMNKYDTSECGVEPYKLLFGSDSTKHFNFPFDDLTVKTAPVYLKQLDQDLRLLRSRSLQYQQDIARERTTQKMPQNVYQAGDLILFQHPKDKPLPSKLGTPFAGPFEVITQVKNDVKCKHVVLGTEREFYVGDVKLFYGSREDAYQLALNDADQYEISHFAAYRGDPLTRTTMEFYVVFKDGTERWLPWSEDLFSTVQYEKYCSSVPALFPLLVRLSATKQAIALLKRTPITCVQPGDEVFVDLRSYGFTWYNTLGLPDSDFKTYVVLYKYIAWKRKNFTLEVFCPIFNETFVVDHLFVKQYGSITDFNSSHMILIDTDFVNKFPSVLPKS